MTTATRVFGLIFVLAWAVPDVAAMEPVPVERYHAEVTAAALALLEQTSADERDRLLLTFDSPARTLGRATGSTPSFCAVIGTCPQGWGLTQCEMTDDQLVAMHKLLSLALSPGGYQTLLAVMNRQRIIGEMEDVGDAGIVAEAVAQDPGALADSIFEFELLAPVPPDLWYPVVGGAFPTATGETVVAWAWNPPGLQARHAQFCRSTFAIFGEPGSERWGFRFEGHHFSVNLTYLLDTSSGRVTVHATPLFFGAFPMIVPRHPFGADDNTNQWAWARGQVLMFSVTHHLRQFWLAVPGAVRDAAFIGPEFFPQAAPLLLDTPSLAMISSLDTTVDSATIESFPHVKMRANALSPEAAWHLRQALLFYTEAMNPNVGPHYLLRIDRMLNSAQQLTLSWAGGALDDLGTHHYSYLAVGPLLLEFMQGNQFSVQHDPAVGGNHVHSMFRDLDFDWTDPMREHHWKHHVVTKCTPAHRCQ